MPLFSAKHVGPVKIDVLDSDVLVLGVDRTHKLPLLIASAGILAVCLGILLPWLRVILLIIGSAAVFGSACFILLRAKITLSKKTATLERGPIFSLVKTKRNTLRISFADIREILVEAEFEASPGEPLIWQLTIVTTDDMHYPLTWHFFQEPVSQAAKEVSRITGKIVREERDPWNTSKWERWGYNFLR